MANNSNSIIRVQKDKNNPYVMLNKGFLNDERLSFKAKGILAYLLSKPDNWKVRVGDLVKHSPDGRTAVYSGLSELKEYGYLERFAVRVDGKIHHWESIIYEVPTIPEKPSVENTQNVEVEDFQEDESDEKQQQAELLLENLNQENPDYNNKRDLINKDIQSINQSDGEELQEIFVQSRVNTFEDDEVKETIKQAIKELHTDAETRQVIKRVKIEHITDANNRYKVEYDAGTQINDPMQYYKAILIKCINHGGFGKVFKA